MYETRHGYKEDNITESIGLDHLHQDKAAMKGKLSRRYRRRDRQTILTLKAPNKNAADDTLFSYFYLLRK